MLRAIIAVLICIVWLLSVGARRSAADVTVRVSAPNRGYRCAPVAVEVGKPETAQAVRVTDGATGELVPAQMSVAGNQAIVRWLVRDLPHGASRRYRIAFDGAGPTTETGGVRLKTLEEHGAVEVSINGELFTRYCFAGAPKPYCYPIIGPTGVPVTRSYPMEMVEGETRDHPHQRSFWFTHGEVNGVDFWAEGADKGKQVHREFVRLEEGPVCGAIRAINDWVTADGKKVCEDERELRVYNVPGVRLMDFTVTIRATEGPVEFGDTKEGTFGIRVASAMDVTEAHPQAQIVNSEGQTNADAWGKQARWCDYSGLVGGKIVGISIFDHPSSFRHPTYWHVRTYGLFAANPFGLRHFIGDQEGKGRFTLAKGQEVTFRYRVLIHPGNVEEARVADWYGEYADPPQIEVE